MMKTSSFGSRVRKRLSDITNMHSNPKSLLKDSENDLPALNDSTTKNYVQQLLKENALMMKLIQEKDKIIESNGLELQKLRVNLQRTQLQNWHLAQSNTQMLAELNMGKDKLKALRHDLACKDALYKAKMLVSQEEAKMQHEENIKLGGKTRPKKADEDQSKQANDNIENKVPKTQRGSATRRQSFGATSSQQADDKEIAENKRCCLRRQSVRLKPQEPQADLFEINEKAKMQCEENSKQGGESKPMKAAVDQPTQANDNHEIKVSKTKRGHATRSQSLGTTSSQLEVDKELADNKRRCLRRQSARSKPQEPQADLFKIDVNTPLTESLEQPLHTSNSEEEGEKEPLSLPQRSERGRVMRSQSLGATSSQEAVDKEIAENERRYLRRQSDRLKPQEPEADFFEMDVSIPLMEPLQQHLHASNSEREHDNAPLSLPQRSSIGRPSRKAREKIQSYKVSPLNKKMRRP